MARQKAPKSALIVWGGWDGHAPEGCAELFAAWLTCRGFRVVLADTLDVLLKRRRPGRFSVIIPIWTMGELGQAQWEGLRDAVLSGTGLAGFHGGMCDAFRGNPGYQFMTGGQWVEHPGGICRYAVSIDNKKDPITKGLKDFRIRSEQYYLHVDPGNEVLATTTFSGRKGKMPWIRGTRMPVVWKRRYGRGRVFYCALGHGPADFEVPEAFELMKRGIQWSARTDIIPEFSSP